MGKDTHFSRKKGCATYSNCNLNFIHLLLGLPTKGCIPERSSGPQTQECEVFIGNSNVLWVSSLVHKYHCEKQLRARVCSDATEVTKARLK